MLMLLLRVRQPLALTPQLAPPLTPELELLDSPATPGRLGVATFAPAAALEEESIDATFLLRPHASSRDPLYVPPAALPPPVGEGVALFDTGFTATTASPDPDTDPDTDTNADEDEAEAEEEDDEEEAEEAEEAEGFLLSPTATALIFRLGEPLASSSKLTCP